MVLLFCFYLVVNCFVCSRVGVAVVVCLFFKTSIVHLSILQVHSIASSCPNSLATYVFTK